MYATYKNVGSLLLCCMLLYLTGCSGGSFGQEVSIGPYTMQIDEVFIQSPITRFETKRTKGRIIKSYVIPTSIENFQSFEKNIIVGTLPNTKNITSEQFAKIGIKTIQSTFQGYKKYDLKKRTVTCGKEKVEIYMHTYYITLHQEKELRGYYIGQAYFGDKTTLYTISAASNVEQDVERFLQYFKTIECKKTANATKQQE